MSNDTAPKLYFTLNRDKLFYWADHLDKHTLFEFLRQVALGKRVMVDGKLQHIYRPMTISMCSKLEGLRFITMKPGSGGPTRPVNIRARNKHNNIRLPHGKRWNEILREPWSEDGVGCRLGIIMVMALFADNHTGYSCVDRTQLLDLVERYPDIAVKGAGEYLVKNGFMRREADHYVRVNPDAPVSWFTGDWAVPVAAVDPVAVLVAPVDPVAPVAPVAVSDELTQRERALAGFYQMEPEYVHKGKFHPDNALKYLAKDKETKGHIFEYLETTYGRHLTDGDDYQAVIKFVNELNAVDYEIVYEKPKSKF